MKHLKRRVLSGFFSGVFLSALAHASVAGGLYWWMTKTAPPAIVADLDLSMQPLMSQPPNAGGGRARPAEEWRLPPKNKKAPAPAPQIQAAAPSLDDEEVSDAPCPDPCPEGDGSGGGGTGEGHGLYVPASETSRKPRWVGNFITDRDYPLLAKQNGKDGRVVLTVWIDQKGQVQDVRLLQGAYEPLNEAALRKVRQAKFTPAYDAKGDAVPCQVTLPIRFELK